jgi:glycosyltransferase involved in cell wall biosynthesis
MRVTIVGRDFPPRPGGIADHTDRLATSLALLGHSVSVVCAPPADHRDAFDVYATVDEDLIMLVRTTRPEAIVWQYNPFSIGSRGMANGAGARAHALAAIAPLTVFFHEMWFPWGRNGLRGLLWAIAQRRQGRAVLRACTHAIVTTPEREAQARRPVHRIPVGTNIDPVTDSKPSARALLGIPAGAYVVAHLGGTGPGRDLVPVSEAVGTIGGLLYLVGETGPDRPTGDHVWAPGREDPERLSLALRAADVYVHADPVGASAGRRTSLVAALAHSLPVVAYAGPQCAPELAGVIIEVPRDARDVAEALVRLRDDPGERLRSGLRNRQIFDEHFSWRRIAEDVEHVLLST